MTEQPPKSEELLKTLLTDNAQSQPTSASGLVIPPHIDSDDDEDVDSLIDDLEHVVSEAKRVPFGKKLMIDEDRMLALIDRLRTAVPNEVKQAHRVLDEQERIINEAREQARQMLTERGLQAQLDVERDQVIARATVDADRIRTEADRYVRNVLETLNERLIKAQTSVQKGLETLILANKWEYHMEYEAVIGLEVHAQVLTNSKMFCGCSADYANAAPNTHLCPVCLGLPGALPVVNQHATELIALTGLALNCRINPTNIISRKQYFYVDLPSNYQRTQYEEPICSDGWVMIEVGNEQHRIGITRAHMEEDTGKLQHAVDGSLIDYNRAGVPLMEIVSEPDLRTPEEARLYLQKMRQILVWIGVNSGNLEDGAFRCDANVSVRPKGSMTFGTKVEVKNMNSFRNVERALHAEIERQSRLLATGGTVLQETRGWDEIRGTTVGQRSKEQAHDYRYFPEPDIPPIQLAPEWVEARQAALPVLPDERRQHFINEYGLSLQDAMLLTDERIVADYYEQAVAAAPDQTPKAVANWMTSELFRLLNETGESLDVAAERVPPSMIAELLKLLKDGTVTGPVAKQVWEETFRTGQSPAAIVETKGLRQISDTSAITELARSAVAGNPKAVAEYKAGKSQAIKFLVGQIMKASKGQANPQLAEQALATVLAE